MEEEEGEENQQEQTQYDEKGNKIIKVREMSELEKKYFQEARKRHRENITKQQIVQGKVFTGKAFLSKPDKIIFKDFEIGQPYTQTIYLTNASYAKNSFKLVPLTESIRDFFEIIYTPKGYMSPGTACAITIRFFPQLNQDIDDVFPILAETGPINFPLICLCKKAIVKCENPELDFGHVIYGEDGTKHLKLVNEGALPTEVIIKGSKGIDIGAKTEIQSEKGENMKQSQSSQKDDQQLNLEKCLTQLKFQKTYTIQGYSTLSIPIKYIPNEVGKFNLPLLLYFENYLHSPAINTVFKGECTEVPIYVEKQLYDFEICLLNHIYREKIVFLNRSANAMKVQVIAPKETNNFFEFNPMLGYIQGNSKFEVWLKMSAEKDLLTYCQKYLVGDGILEIPFKLVGADQIVPVIFTIRAKLTIDIIQITPGKINFGTLYEGTASRMPLLLENQSDLPQEIIFYPLPKEIQIELDLIPIKLLPKEKFQINLIYRSGKLIDNKKDEGYLHCKIITGEISTRDIRIPYSCDIKKSPLEISAQKIDIPVLQIDEMFITQIEVKNNSYKDMIFEYFLPLFEICGIKINPMVKNIKPGASVEITIEYYSVFKKLTAFTLMELTQKYDNDPNYNFETKLKLKQQEQRKLLLEQDNQQQDDNNKKGGAQGKDSKKADKKGDDKAKKGNKQQEKEQQEEAKRIAELEKQRQEEEKKKREDLEKNFDQEGELAKMGGKLLEFNQGSSSFSQHYTWLIPFYFKNIDQSDNSRYTTFIEITTVSVGKSLQLNSTEIDFGEIAVGIREIRELYIQNLSDLTADIRMDLLPEGSGFSVINALRPIEPKKVRTLVVQFQPQDEQPFQETLKISCRTTTVSAKLKGKGVKPEVQVIPEDGLLNLGGVVLGESYERVFKIKNISNFDIKMKIDSKASGINNKNGSKVFSFIPAESIIDAHQEIDVKIIFKPDKVSEKFFEYITVDVPNQKAEKSLFVYGSCYPRSAYLTYFEPYLSLPKVTSINQKFERAFDSLKIQDEQCIFSPLNPKIMLEFTKIKQKIQIKDEEQKVQQQPQSQQEDEKCFVRKIQIGNCKIYSDPKLEKAVQYDIVLQKDDKYFSCDNIKGTVNPGQNPVIIPFTFKPSNVDPTIANIEALRGLGQWKEVKAELKLTGGFLRQGVQDAWTFEIILRAYINQI